MNTVEAKSILQFTEGDIVCLVKCSTTGDGSYLGIPIKLLGVVNNLIYGEIQENRFPWTIGDIVELDIEKWGDIWSEYVNPEKELGINLDRQEKAKFNT